MDSKRSSGHLKIIIDSNIFIDIEDHGTQSSERTGNAARFMRLAAQNNAAIVVAEATRQDLVRSEEPRRSRRLSELSKYEILAKPYIPPILKHHAGYFEPLSENDQCDLEILAALTNGAADWLITEDAKFRRRALRSGCIERVFSLQEVIEALEGFLSVPTSIPEIRIVKGYEVNIDAELFSGLKQDYSGFVDWWRNNVSRDNRDILILGENSSPEGLSVTKIEVTGEHNLGPRSLKLCTFKVADEYGGNRRGELLLKASIDYARKNGCHSIYVEVLPSKTWLVDWFSVFGFLQMQNETTKRGELILVKHLAPHDSLEHALSPLDHSIKYGPGSILVNEPIVIPIQPHWRERLFPEASEQLSLLSLVNPCGNAIRKAYLCNGAARYVQSGDTILFYETQKRSAVIVTGVVESVLVSRDVDEIIGLVGNRTVYSRSEIATLCQKEVVTILFRFDRIISPTWPLNLLKRAGVLKSHPQSVQRAKLGGVEWIRRQLEG